MIGHRSVHRGSALGTVALVLALAAVPLVATPASAAPTPLGVNLVLNPGAEAGAGTNGYTPVAVPGWQTYGNFTVVKYGSPEFPTKAESNRIDGGKKFFSCGPDTDAAGAQQKIFIKGRGALIDAGRIRVKVKVRMAGYLNGHDQGEVYVGLYDADVSPFGGVQIYQSTGTSGQFRLKRGSKVLPAGTRMLWVGLFGVRASDGGSYCDAYFDNISVTLERVD